MQIERAHRHSNFDNRDGQGRGHHDQAQREHNLSRENPSEKEQAHRECAAKQTAGPNRLHVANQIDAFSKIFDFAQVMGILRLLMVCMQLPNHACKSQESVGVSEKQQRNRWKEQCWGGQVKGNGGRSGSRTPAADG